MSNIFAGGRFDRLAERRTDADWLAAAMNSEHARFLVAWDQLSPVVWYEDKPLAAWLTAEQVAVWKNTAREVILLGESGGRWLFGLNFDAPPDESLPFTPSDLYRIGAQLDANEASLLGWFRALCHWHRTHRFCSQCGQPTDVIAAGHERYCEHCDRRHFPRVDPAVIVLVEREGRCLLGRKRGWVKPTYSTLAGFIEPGESPEEAVCREVFEEAGVEVSAVRYHSSQPWPFPASLMIGFGATARTGNIQLRDGELNDARWFSRAELDASLARGDVKLPSGSSIALRLIRDWYEQDGSRLPSTVAATVSAYY